MKPASPLRTAHHLEIHKPKPSHTLREFLSEVAVVLLGIVIALAGEQTLLSLESRHKIRLVAEEMRQEISGDDGPQALERIALSKCVDSTLDAIRGLAERNAGRSAILDSIARFATPLHTWDSIAFQAALSAGILAQMPPDRVDAVSRFYSLMPALQSANEREFRDGASLAAISRAGGPLTESERGQVLNAVETLRRDNAQIVRFSFLAEAAMKQLGVNIRDYRFLAGGVSSLQDPQRVINEVQAMPMAQQCVNDVKMSLADIR
jgi:hypothetical protein